MATPASLAGRSMDAAITRVVGVVSFGFGVSAAGASRASAMTAGEGVREGVLMMGLLGSGGWRVGLQVGGSLCVVIGFGGWETQLLPPTTHQPPNYGVGGGRGSGE